MGSFTIEIKNKKEQELNGSLKVLTRRTMVKKALNPLRIDFKKCIVEERLLQVRNQQSADQPELVSVWTTEIETRDSKKFIDFVRRKVQSEDPVVFTHVKRIRKLEGSTNTLIVIICSFEFIRERYECESLLEQSGLEYKNLSSEHSVPRHGAPTKELVIQWSKKYWPLTWCGNPNDQILNDYIFDMDFIKSILALISSIANREAGKGKGYPIVTAFVSPNSKEDPIISVDARFDDNSFLLDHSIMKGIKKVAQNTKKESIELNDGVAQDQSQYLCLDFDVYTTHEPCSMCAMALIHSRIKRCIFIREMPQTGSLKAESGDGYCMHNNRLLNSKYEVFQWIGDEYPTTEIPPNVCC